MAYGVIHDKAAGRVRWTVNDGKILDEDGTQVGVERDGIAYRMSGEVWGVLENLESAAPASAVAKMGPPDPAP